MTVHQASRDINKKPYQRKERVATQLQQALAVHLATRALDPRLHGVTVVEVDCSPDLRRATVYVNAPDNAQGSFLAVLQSASTHLRQTLAKQLALRVVPKLHFRSADRQEQACRLLHLLDAIPEATTSTE
jgi:ribosome-binding factor A